MVNRLRVSNGRVGEPLRSASIGQGSTGLLRLATHHDLGESVSRLPQHGGGRARHTDSEQPKSVESGSAARRPRAA